MPLPISLPDGVTLRLLRPDDGPALAEAYTRNREHLAPWEPARTEAFFTAERQTAQVLVGLREHEAGRQCPLVLARGDAIVGRVNVSDVVRGVFQNGHLGYWVDAGLAGRGIMTAAVRATVGLARDDLGLHRLQAATLLHNTASQRVLERAGFARIGLAPRYLRIAGRWADHLLFQRILHDEPA
ncbi:GNAT family N-acetyltransferase [Isoptericola halotolerans]|uniref:GNAT family N-acetyltransferase n=1 Tax=Isoptericola halotolerans TaxID=300560 RepID=UPI00388FBE69